MNAQMALFLSPDGNIYPDTLICSGVIPSELGGKPCPYACDGGIPDAVPLNPDDATYTPDKGQPGDLCPLCVKQQLSNLGHWQGHGGQTFPEELLTLRLFKCRQWFWLVIPGLEDQSPDKIVPGGPYEHPANGPVRYAGAGTEARAGTTQVCR